MHHHALPVFPSIFRSVHPQILALSGFFLTVSQAIAGIDPVYIADHPELIISSQQGWGELGLNSAAHAPGIPGEPLRIADSSYLNGLGTHANGSLTIGLEGSYASFEALAGVHPCQSGSVVFRVFVDGQKRFESGVIRSGDAATPIDIALNGAQELRLEAADAGDGITCDMANWANACLLPLTSHVAQAISPAPDMAPFGRIATWDPHRKNGATANRLEEFRAEDLFTETELRPQSSGFYRVPVFKDLGCIGIQWMNRRRVKELAIEFAPGSSLPSAAQTAVEGWFGESAWQGGWKPLQGSIRPEDNKLVFTLAPKAGFLETSKVRWLVPATNGTLLLRPAAFTRSAWATTNLFVQLEKPSRSASVSIYNGEATAVRPQMKSGQSLRLSEPLELSVRYSLPAALNADPTQLRFHLPAGDVTIAVADVLTNDCVYVPDLGLFAARLPLPVSLQNYKRSITQRRSILDEVRSLPDQSLAQAMEHTHHAFQNEGPVMLSLACDNVKFVLERDGCIRFHPEPFEWLAQNSQVDWSPWYNSGSVLKIELGKESPRQFTRQLEGGWLPIVVQTTQAGGIIYTQRSFVAPVPALHAPSSHQPMCVVEITARNSTGAATEAQGRLSFLATANPEKPAALERRGRLIIISKEDRPIALVDSGKDERLAAEISGGELSFHQRLSPGDACTLTVYLPGEPVSPSEIVASQLAQPASRLAAAATRYWEEVLDKSMQVETPEDLLNNVIRSSQVRCLIDARSEAAGQRVAASIAAMSYGPLESEANSVIRGMDFTGNADFARRALDFFLYRYNTNGFLTTGYTTFGTAWNLWSISEHYSLTGDQDWLRQIAPQLIRACDWSGRQLEKTMRLDPDGNPVPEYGLMPPGVLADWNAFACHFTMNAYYAAGLRGVGNALKDIGHPDAARLLKQAKQLRENTLRAYAWTQSRSPVLPLRNGTWIPHYPSQVHAPGKLAEFFPGQDAGRSWCYDVEVGGHQLVPAGVLDPASREVERMMEHMEDVQFLCDGWFDYPAASNRFDWFNLGGFSKVQPYYTRGCEIYALRDDIKPFIRSYFNSLASLLNPEVLTLWEHFHHSGAWDKTHETGYFLHQTRTLLVQERGEDLWLAPFVPTQWLHNGKRLKVSQAPSRFGQVSFTIRSHVSEGYIDATVEPPVRHSPKHLALRLRHPEGKPIRAVTVNGKRCRTFDPATQTITIPALNQTLNVRAEFF